MGIADDRLQLAGRHTVSDRWGGENGLSLILSAIVRALRPHCFSHGIPLGCPGLGRTSFPQRAIVERQVSAHREAIVGFGTGLDFVAMPRMGADILGLKSRGASRLTMTILVRAGATRLASGSGDRLRSRTQLDWRRTSQTQYQRATRGSPQPRREQTTAHVGKLVRRHCHTVQ